MAFRDTAYLDGVRIRTGLSGIKIGKEKISWGDMKFSYNYIHGHHLDCPRLRKGFEVSYRYADRVLDFVTNYKFAKAAGIPLREMWKKKDIRTRSFHYVYLHNRLRIWDRKKEAWACEWIDNPIWIRYWYGGKTNKRSDLYILNELNGVVREFRFPVEYSDRCGALNDVAEMNRWFCKGKRQEYRCDHFGQEFIWDGDKLTIRNKTCDRIVGNLIGIESIKDRRRKQPYGIKLISGNGEQFNIILKTEACHHKNTERVVNNLRYFIKPISV